MRHDGEMAIANGSFSDVHVPELLYAECVSFSMVFHLDLSGGIMLLASTGAEFHLQN